MGIDSLMSSIGRPRYIFAAGLGLAFAWFSIWFWGWYVVDNPITNRLLDDYARSGQENTFYALTRLHDFLVNFALAIPVAAILYRVAGKRGWRSVWITVVAFHVFYFWGSEFSNFHLLIRFTSFWVGLITTIVVIPLAFMLITATTAFVSRS